MRKLILPICLIALGGIVWTLVSRRPGQPSTVPAAPVASRPSHPAASAPRPGVASAVARPPLPIPLRSLQPVPAFARWLDRYRQGTPEARAILLKEGTELARQRQAALFDLIAKDPAAALAAAVGEQMRQMLPETILPLLEHPMSAQGDLIAIATEPAPGARDVPAVYREAHIDGQTYEAFVYGRRENQQTKYGTSLIGITLQNRMAVLEEPARILSMDDLPPGTLLEKPVTEPSPTGDTPAATGTYVVQVAGRYYPVASGAQAASIASRWAAAESHPGPILQADGASLPGLDVAPSTVLVPQIASSHLLGPQSVLVILTDFTDFPGSPVDITTTPNTTITSDYVNHRLTIDVADFYTQASYGKATIGNVDVTPVLRMPPTLASYSTTNNTSGLENDAKNAAKNAGFVLENYNRVIVVFHDTHTITNDKFYWTGLAELGGSFAWINGNFDLGVVAHEEGHNFGLSHARLWQIPTTSTDPVDPAGTSLDYGDVFDIMGHAHSDRVTQPDPPNPWYLNNLGWLPDSAVQTVTADGTYPVYRFDDQNATLNTPLALRVNRSEGTDYWIAFRRKFLGDPTYGNISNGAYVFWALTGNPSSQLIDINPVLGSNPPTLVAQDAGLPNGQTFVDSAAGITIKVNDIGGTAPNEYLDVSITYQTRVAFEHKINDVDEQSGSITLNVYRLNSSTGAVSVPYSTFDGTAHTPGNYTATSGTLFWADGDKTPLTIVVPIIANSLTAATATFTVAFNTTTSTGCVFPGGSVATVNIVQPGAADPRFVHPFLTNSVNTLALQPDGSLVIGGDFDNTPPLTSSGISRLLPGGTLDTTFDQGAGATPLPVNVMARQPDGKILVAGAFTTLRGVARNHLARLQPNGSLDTSFDPGVGPGNSTASRNVINTIAVQPDGKILVGGQFLTWNGTTNKTLVRLNEDGTLDAGFTHFATQVLFFAGYETVNSIALQPCVSPPCFALVVGGGFYRPLSSGGYHSGIVRLKADGTRDTTFDALQGSHARGNSNNLLDVTTVAVQIDGKILAAGQFTGFNGVGVNGFVRLNSTGSNDTSFVTKLGSAFTSTQYYWDVFALYAQPDGKILTGGYFEKAAGIARFNLARFNADGTLDSTFSPAIDNPPSNNGVNAMAVAPDNSIFIALNNSGDNPLVIKRLFSGLSAQPGVMQFPSPVATVTEGTSTAVTVERVGGTFGPVSVNYHTIASSAIEGTDFTVSSGTLTWASGDGAPKTIAVPTMITAVTGTAKVFEIHLGIPLGGASIGQNAIAGVTILDADISQIPQIGFAATTATYTESNSTQTVTVQLSLTHADTIAVPFTVGGTALAGSTKAYTISASPLTFAPGVTSQDITLNLREDTVVEPDRTIIITLQPPTSGNVLLGAAAQFTATLKDDDIRPSFTTAPASALLSIGAGVTFTSVSTGNPPPSLLWYKNRVKIAPVVTGSGYSISNAQLTHAGQYSVTATNIFGSATAIAELGVVDPTPKTYNVTIGATATLTVSTAGNALTYAWTKAGAPVLSPPRITASAKSLIIKTLTPADAGEYTCAVSGPGTGPIPISLTLNVIDGPPVITNTGAMTDGIVSGTYAYPITVDGLENHTPAIYSALYLPAGLTCNATTGLISGKPTASTKGSHINVTLKATNAKGIGPSSTFLTTLLINDLPTNTIGSYVAPVDRSGLNSGLGGRFDLAVTSTGAYTGTLTLGATGYPFKGVLNTTVGATTSSGDVMVTRTGKTQAHLTFTIEAATTRITTGAIAADTFTESFTGWRNTIPTSTYVGYQTFSMKTDDALINDDSVPHGLGYGSFTVPATAAAFNVAGVLADGTAYTSSSSLGSLGDVLIYQALYTGTKGSILGTLNVLPGTQALNADSTLAGSLTWLRPLIVGRTYASGFGPLTLAAVGGRYIAPNATTIPPGFVVPTTGVPNASIAFTSAHVTDGTPIADLLFTIKPGGSVTVPVNPAKTTFIFVASTGAFSGGFTQTTPAIRSGTFKGMLVNHLGTFGGDGWFTLPQLPLPTTSPILSGKVLLAPH